MFNKFFLIVAIVSLLIVASSDMAQRADTPNTRPDVQAIILQSQQRTHQRLVAKVEADLGISDADFAVLQPLVEKCIETRDVARVSSDTKSVGVRHSPKDALQPNPPLPALPPLPTPTERALQDLDRMLHDPDATKAAIQAQMQLVRRDRQQADDDYAAACKELRALVTRRQEVVLFLNGVLD